MGHGVCLSTGHPVVGSSHQLDRRQSDFQHSAPHVGVFSSPRWSTEVAAIGAQKALVCLASL